MTFDPKAYADECRKMDAEKLLSRYVLSIAVRFRHTPEYAELLRRLRPKVDRARLHEAYRDWADTFADDIDPGSVAKWIADLIESGRVPMETTDGTD